MDRSLRPHPTTTGLSEMNDRNHQNQDELALGTAVGVAIGVAIGVATGNVAVGVGVGVALGAGLGSAMRTPKGCSGPDESSDL